MAGQSPGVNLVVATCQVRASLESDIISRPKRARAIEREREKHCFYFKQISVRCLWDRKTGTRLIDIDEA